MKKFLLFLMFAMFCIPWAANAQTTVTIGDLETATNDSYLPMNSLYEYSYSQQIYTADEIGMAGTINSITVWLYGNENLYEMPFDIYMVETDKEAFASSTDWVTAPGQLVYSGSVTVHNTTAEAYTFVLATPFVYSGTGNLLISFDNNTGQWVSGLNGMVFTAEDGALRAIYARRDNTDYDPFNMASITANGTAAKRNVIELDITPASGPTCERPDNFEVSNITANGADFAWTGTVGNYTFEYKKASESDWTVVTGITVNSYSLNTLESYTTYNVRVKAVCDVDLESGYKTASFTTPEVCPDGMVCIGTGSTATSTSLPANNYYNYSLSQQIYTAAELGEAGAILSIDFYKASTTEMEKTLDIYMVNTNKTSFDSTTDWIAVTAADLVFSGTVTFADNDWTTIGLDAPFVFDGSSNVAIIVDNNTGAYVSSTPFRAFSTGETSQAIYQYSDGTNVDPLAAITTAGNLSTMKNHIRLNIGEPPACPRPAGVTVNYEGGTEATISWTSDATAWNIDVNGTVTAITENPYTLTNLELSTDYEVKVQADCGDAESEWTNAVSFTTDDCMLEEQVSVNYTLNDSYGDGWNGNYILVVDENCNIVNQLTIESGYSASGTVKVCGSYVQFLWYAGNYPDETSWSFTDNAGNVLFEGAGSADMATLDVLYTIDNNPYQAPLDVAASEVGPHSAKLSWTQNGDATAWQINLFIGDEEEGTIIDANSNPFVITGLDPETEYYAQVRATGADGTSLWTCLGANFTTTEACPAPTELVVNPFVTSADVTWNGFADAYTLEWALLPETRSTRDAGWLQYDNGSYAGGVGNSTANTWTWGVMYPASMLEGNGLLSKVSIYENSTYNTADITINVYTGGDDAPGTLVYTETVTPVAGDDFHEITFAEPVTIDPTQNLWITLTEYGTYVLSYCTGTEANNDWVNSGSTWAHIGDLSSSLASDNWMIRGYVEPAYDPDQVDWTTIEGVTSPYTIEGLDPETTYLVRVKANCGGEDGESSWSQTSFTTKTACDAPNSLAADVEGTTATLSWNAYQESFNLYYRQQVADPTASATIILEANDVWGDGSGYMMLLDADTNTAGVLWNANHYIFVEGEQYSGGDIPASYFDEFEYKIPTGANGALDDSINVVVTGSVTIQIPAGTYDYVILNPTPGDRFYIASDNGEVGTAEDNFVFEAGVTYHFTMQRFGNNDGAAFEIIRPMSDWVVVENVTTPYELTGLEPETYYEWYVEGINANCTDALVSEIETFTTGEQAPQTIALSAGWNWVSVNVDVTVDDLKAALLEAVPNTAIQIKGKGSSTSYDPARNRWLGTLAWDVANMYKIKVAADCEIELEGMPLDPAEASFTVVNGANWIGFPLNQSMTLTDAFAGFAANGDQIKGKTGSATYNRGRWQGSTLNSLEPGKGYVYISASSESRPLVFPNSAR